MECNCRRETVLKRSECGAGFAAAPTETGAPSPHEPKSYESIKETSSRRGCAGHIRNDQARGRAAGHGILLPGPARPERAAGQLKRSARAYDTRVAGIVSGANGIKPGIALKQEGALDHARAQGAILGKAMSALGDGKGLVLVLVTLQQLNWKQA